MSCLNSWQKIVTFLGCSWQTNAQKAEALSIHEASIWICGAGCKPYRQRQNERLLWWKRPLHSVPWAGLSGGLQHWDISRSLHPRQNLPDHKRPFEDAERRGRKHVWIKSKKKNWKGYQPGSSPSGNLSQSIWNLSTQVMPASLFRPLFFPCAQPAEAKTLTTWRSPWRACC